MAVAGSSKAGDAVPYILIHSDREIRRLKHQADIINPITRRILMFAGIGPGMRVLDIGCGAGDVSMLIAELVGESGEVVGVDRVPAALAAAERKAMEHGRRNVSFRQGDPGTLSFDRPFDAVVGRYVLMFQADPAELIRGAALHVRPGGIVAFHEPDWTGARSQPPSRYYDLCCEYIVETFRRTGIETHMGAKLDAAFREAGLMAPTMHLESVVGGGNGGRDWAHQTSELLVTMLPEVVSRGVATADTIDIDAMEAGIMRDIDAGTVIMGRSEIGAWARKGGH
jgi:2-polyprenyl-3-methyl-5-hydroxy-6-metoxy-1,4-benzoquinol methylase